METQEEPAEKYTGIMYEPVLDVSLYIVRTVPVYKLIYDLNALDIFSYFDIVIRLCQDGVIRQYINCDLKQEDRPYPLLHNEMVDIPIELFIDALYTTSIDSHINYLTDNIENFVNISNHAVVTAIMILNKRKG